MVGITLFVNMPMVGKKGAFDLFQHVSMQMVYKQWPMKIITTKSYQICLCAFRCPLWMALIGQLKLDNDQCQMVQQLVKLMAPCEGNP